MTASNGHRYALPPGHRLGEYRIERYLGSGGFGITYTAIDENLGHRVAIKEYLPTDLAVRDADNSIVSKSSEDEQNFLWGLDRFLDEARSLAQFDHPNVVRVQRFLRAHGTRYIVMEYVDGEPLSEMLKRCCTLTEAEIREHILPITDGLTHIHASGVLHRDIKPGNIMIRRNGVPVLIDFGSAREAVSTKSKSVTSVLTEGYAPLEQYSTRAKQSPATDIYALGAVLYRCVTGETPVAATERVLEDRDGLIPVTEAAKGNYSAGLLKAIDAALRIRADQRPQDVGRFLDSVASDDIQRRKSKGSSRDLDSTVGRSSFDLRRWLSGEKSAARVSGKRAARWAAVAVLMVLGAWWLIPINVDDQGEEVRAPAEQPPVIEMPRSTNEDVAADARPPGRESVRGGGTLLVVETTPEGVEVLLDGEPVGVTPLELGNVRAGTHDVVLRHPEYETLELADESFADGRVLRIERTLVRATGALTVVTQPREAWVERDGVRLADGTPVTLDDLPAGSVTLRLGAAEYRSQEVVANVPKGDVGLLEWTLEPIQYGTLTLDLEPADAVVMLPDAGLPFSSGLRLPEGAHRLVVSRQGYHTVERAVEISGETRVRISLEMDPQPFTVQAIPAQAQVELVEPALVYTPGMRLEPGVYRVRVSAFGYQPWEEALRHGSEPTNLTAELSPLYGETFADDLSSGGNGPEMVVIPPGRFRMGCVSGLGCSDSERPVHDVTIPRAFAVSKYEVTFEEWDACVADGGCGGYRPADAGWGRGRRPVINVSWDDAHAYGTWLSRQTGQSYRLLSEAEWEYVARAGTSTTYSWGNSIGSNQANCHGCGSRWDSWQTAPVGSFPANAFGVHDMHGNVWEWTEDCRNTNYVGAPVEGESWLAGNCQGRVMRGGSFDQEPWILRSANRDWNPASTGALRIGIRLARSLEP